MDRLQWIFLACITVRCLFAALALFLFYETRNKENITTASYLTSVFCFIVSIGFVYQTVLKRQFGRFGGKVWWKRMRYIHSILWFLAGCFSLLPEMVWWLRGSPLVLDVTVGAVVGTLHYKYSLVF